MATTPANSASAAPVANGTRPPFGWKQALHTFGLFVYYLAILILLLWIYGRGDAPTAPFIYQGF